MRFIFYKWLDSKFMDNVSMLASNAAGARDVFVCFSKSRPGEAKVAIALKDVLEQHGLFAFEYEHWSWVDRGAGDDADVDRVTLQQMLTACSVVVLISPHEGEASAGVQTEIAELRSSGSPVILLHWSPNGWHPLLEPERFEGLNIVWYHEGRSTADRDVADNQCEFIAQQIGMGSWLACQIHRLNTEHAAAAGWMLDRLPESSEHPLLNLRLQQPGAEAAQDDEDVDIAALAADAAKQGEPDALRDFLDFWRNGTDLMAATLADEARFSLKRPMRHFFTACDSLCAAAEKRLGFPEISGAVLKDRGLMLARLDRVDEAIDVLTQALDSVPAEERYEVFQALALAQQEDPQAAIHSLTSAIACAPHIEIELGLTYDRGALRTKAEDHVAALEDFSRVADASGETALRQSALRARAIIHTKLNDYDAAIADYTEVLTNADRTPRTAVSAWMDRAALYRLQHRDVEAIQDLTRAIDHADADPLQRFRSLEARAGLLLGQGQDLAAASDYEAMAEYTNASREYRDELRRDAARLRSVPRPNSE